MFHYTTLYGALFGFVIGCLFMWAIAYRQRQQREERFLRAETSLRQLLQETTSGYQKDKIIVLRSEHQRIRNEVH